jgi:hypothetical protein
MAMVVKLVVAEPAEALKKRFSKAPNYHRPRLKMLLLIITEQAITNAGPGC